MTTFHVLAMRLIESPAYHRWASMHAVSVRWKQWAERRQTQAVQRMLKLCLCAACLTSVKGPTP